MADDIKIDEKLRKVFRFVEAQTKVLMDKLEIEGASVEEMEKLIREHLKLWYSFEDDGRLKCGNIPILFQFDDYFEWVNTKTPRGDLNALAASNLIIFDFFTHCCIDCIHSIEDLRQVHLYVKSIRSKTSEPNSDFQCGFKIISIHSPKFTTEKKSDSIQSSVQRMKMEHTEVLNDPYQILWRQFGLHCWPTIMIFGPNLNLDQPGPNLLFAFTLDNHREFLKLISKVALKFFDERVTSKMVDQFTKGLTQEDLKVKVAACDFQDALRSKSFLNFPGKVAVHEDLVCISDTGNNRIVVSNLEGEIQDVIGGIEDGYQDGNFTDAKFYGPQGVEFETRRIFYVADTGNHSIRKVDLDAKLVSTLVPPGHAILNLKSPWDLTFYTPDVLLVAGARSHQIFGYFFSETQIFGKSHQAGEVALVAGTGYEENRNHPQPLQASFSQPSGLVCTGSGTKRTMYIADSESSSIRCISGSEGEVLPVVGASTDLYNLFSFGDVDGVSFDAKLQHPMGVTAAGESTIYLTDTYNHKIKQIDTKTLECTNLIGTGEPGNQLGNFNLKNQESEGNLKTLATFNEPAGICIDSSGKYLFIADTNNHTIKVAHLEHRIVSELILNSPSNASPEKFDQIFELPSPSSKYPQLTINIQNIPESFEGGNWKLQIPIYGPGPLSSGNLVRKGTDEAVKIETSLPFVPWLREARINFTVAFCKDSGCHLRNFKLLINFKEGGMLTDENLELNFAPEKGVF